MKYKFMIIPENQEERNLVLDFLDNNNANIVVNENKDDNQQELPGTPQCSKCGKQVEQKVVNFCNVRYKGKIICRECQKEES